MKEFDELFSAIRKVADEGYEELAGELSVRLQVLRLALTDAFGIPNFEGESEWERWDRLHQAAIALRCRKNYIASPSELKLREACKRLRQRAVAVEGTALDLAREMGQHIRREREATAASEQMKRVIENLSRDRQAMWDIMCASGITLEQLNAASKAVGVCPSFRFLKDIDHSAFIRAAKQGSPVVFSTPEKEHPSICRQCGRQADLFCSCAKCETSKDPFNSCNACSAADSRLTTDHMEHRGELPKWRKWRP